MEANVALGTCLLRLSSCIVRPASCAAMIAVLLGASADIALSQDQSAATFKDEIFARKIMMDSIDDHMDAIDWMLTSGRVIDLNKSFEHADAISIMLMAFPHLFCPGPTNGAPTPIAIPLAIPSPLPTSGRILRTSIS